MTRKSAGITQLRVQLLIFRLHSEQFGTQFGINHVFTVARIAPLLSDWSSSAARRLSANRLLLTNPDGWQGFVVNMHASLCRPDDRHGYVHPVLRAGKCPVSAQAAQKSANQPNAPGG